MMAERKNDNIMLTANDISTLSEEAREQNIVLFIGSGLSYPLFPLWKEFADKAKKLAMDSGAKQENFVDDWNKVDTLEASKKKMPHDSWLSLCDECFCKEVSINDISENYLCVKKTGVCQIVTTNYDSIPAILWPEHDRFCNSADELATIIRRLKSNRHYPFVLKLHGCHTNPNNMVVTKNDYDQILHQNIQMQEFVKFLFNTKTVLFLGFGLVDDNLSWILSNLKTLWGGSIPGAYAVLPNINEGEYSRLLNDFNIHALGYLASDGDHNGFKKVLEKIFSLTETKNVGTTFSRTDLLARETPSKDISKLLYFSQAFPLKGRTRLFYTCRSTFNTPRFSCPSDNETLRNSKTAPTHIPVDEIETAGLCTAFYGVEIFSGQEDNVESAIYCSLSAEKLLKGDSKWHPKNQGEIDELLTDNLIVIGENALSNNLFYRIGHQFPWRHIDSEETVKIHGHSVHNYKVKPSFNNKLGHKISDTIRGQLMDDRQYKWGIITISTNPFAPEKNILFLTGCHREGQYLLLTWLRQNSSMQILQKIITCTSNNTAKYLQIVIKGKLTSNINKGNIRRDWEIETIEDTSKREATPFFSGFFPTSATSSDWNDRMADLSLLARIEDNLAETIRSTLPGSLIELFNNEIQNGENVGLHVTLLELLNSKGHTDQGFASSLLDGDYNFLQELKNAFRVLPPLNLVARQTELTSTSLQVLVDLYGDMKKYFSNQGFEGFDGSVINVMDLVTKCCLDAEDCLPSKYRNKFNSNAVPVPLHITLLRFNPKISQAQRDDAKEWADKNRRKIWGELKDLKIVLSYANKFPFNNPKGVDIK